jgi:metallo-beta-lactamase class B
MTHLATGTFLAALFAATALAQAPTPPSSVPPAMRAHIDAAKTAAGTEWEAVQTAVCNSAVALLNPPAARGRGAGARAGGPPAPPARETWHADPVKVFDNLYFVGMTDYSAWAITTSQGIILLDAIYDYSIQDEVDGGLKTLGLNPADIKYVIVSHGHLDHAGGAKYLQEKYNARLIMSAADYDLLDQQNPSWKPKRDMVATDGMKLTLGDETLTLYLTPGHTEGTISTIIPLREGARPSRRRRMGRHDLQLRSHSPRIEAYQKSAERFRDIAARAGADVMLSNHTPYDRSKVNLPLMKTHKPGEKNPYVVRAEGVRRYLTVVDECAQAALAGLS